MNFSKSLTFILIILAIGCKSDKPVPEPISNKILKSFNELAKESFLKNYESYDLSPLDQRDKVELRDEIENNLDRSNNWSLKVVDSFYIRNYVGDPMNIDYSFVSNKAGKFYFICLPYFYNGWLQSSLYYLNSNSVNDRNPLELKDSVNYSIISLNSPMMDDFFDKEVFDPKHSISKQIGQANHLIYEIFPYLLRNSNSFWGMDLDELLEELNNQPQKNSNYIMNVLNPILYKAQPISGSTFDYRISRNVYGIVITYYSLDECIPNKVKLSFYFIPNRRRFIEMTL